MTIEHVNITDPNIHEPKGVSTANSEDVYIADGVGSGAWAANYPKGVGLAQAGSVLRANGSGGAAWLRTQGWGQYQDSRRTVGTPTQNIATGVRTKMICDGGFLTEEHLPQDASGSLWDVSTNDHVPIAINDVYHIRIGFSAQNYAGATPHLDFAVDIGGSIGEIYWDSVSLRKGGAEQKCSFSFPVFTGATYVPNRGDFYITYTGTGTCDIFATDILIVRESKAYV